MRYYPLAIDSVESLSVAYSVDPACANIIQARMTCSWDTSEDGVSFGPLGSMNIAIIPEASGKGPRFEGRQSLVSIVSQKCPGAYTEFSMEQWTRI